MPKRATSAEDDEESVGQISGGEEPEIETTDADGLRRLSSAEAPQLVAEVEEYVVQQGGGGEDIEEDDGESVESSSGGESIDPLDDESDESVLLDELDESHAPHPGSCTFAHNNDYDIDCECECEQCMFRTYFRSSFLFF